MKLLLLLLPMLGMAQISNPVGVDLDWNLTDSTHLVIGQFCSLKTPCSYTFGNTVTSLTSPGTATLTGTGSGTVYIWLDQSSGLTFGPSSGITGVICTQCFVTASGINSFPSLGAIPLYSWHVTSGTWDNGAPLVGGGAMDFRSSLHGVNFTASYPGMQLVMLPTGTLNIAPDSTSSTGFLQMVPVPSSSTSPCTPGQVANGLSIVPPIPALYVCVDINTWRRAYLAKF